MKYLMLLISICSAVFAQQAVLLNPFDGKFTVSLKAQSAVTADPATCIPGVTADIMRTDLPAKKYCSATNTWTQYGAGSSGTVTSAVIAGTANKITVSGTCTITSTGTCTITIPDSVILVTPNLGTPSALVLTNASGLPASALPAQYKTLTCEPGLGDGLNAITAGTYLESTCWNKTGVTWTLTGVQCFTDNAGTSTLNATNGAGTGLLTGAVTCSSTIASGTQSGTTTIANNDFIKFTFVADGTSKQSTWVISGTY